MRRVVVYGADWCGPTKVLRRKLGEVDIDYLYLNIESEPSKARDAGVAAVPTVLVYEGSDKIKTYVGLVEDLPTKLKELLSE